MAESLPKLARKAPLSTQIAELLRAGIAAGDWPVGTRIPGEVELAERFGTSRNTVREAVRGLVHSGMLEARPGDGTYVCADTELQVALQRRAEQEQLQNVFEVREALERFGARRSAESSTPELIARLGELLDARDATTTPLSYLAVDLEFHLAVVSASGNTLLAELYRDLHRDSTVHPASLPCAGWQETVDAHWGTRDPHRDLVAAIAAGDAATAEAAVSELIRTASNFAAQPVHPEHPG